jgi:hypothetical protein
MPRPWLGALRAGRCADAAMSNAKGARAAPGQSHWSLLWREFPPQRRTPPCPTPGSLVPRTIRPRRPRRCGHVRSILASLRADVRKTGIVVAKRGWISDLGGLRCGTREPSPEGSRGTRTSLDRYTDHARAREPPRVESTKRKLLPGPLGDRATVVDDDGAVPVCAVSFGFVPC